MVDTFLDTVLLSCNARPPLCLPLSDLRFIITPLPLPLPLPSPVSFLLSPRLALFLYLLSLYYQPTSSLVHPLPGRASLFSHGSFFRRMNTKRWIASLFAQPRPARSRFVVQKSCDFSTNSRVLLGTQFTNDRDHATTSPRVPSRSLSVPGGIDLFPMERIPKISDDHAATP